MEVIDGVEVDARLSDEEKFCLVWAHHREAGWAAWSHWQSETWERLSGEQRPRINKKLNWAAHANSNDL